MANPRVKHASVFFNGKRIATLQNVSYRIKTNDSQEMADGGTYNTDGITTTEVSCDTIVPLAGIGVSIVQDAVEHKDIDLTVGIVDGKLHELIGCRASEIEFSSEVASGKMTGKFTFFGGNPRITG